MTQKPRQEEIRNRSGETMRDQTRDEGLRDARGCEEPADRSPLDDRYFISRDEIAKIFAGAPRIDPKRFREDIDAYVDPSPRDWPY
jgi:hypothetical protein